MDGVQTSLIQIALAVTQTLGNDEAVDGVQPMWAGWCIYVRTQADHNELVTKGITVAGKYIALCSEFQSSYKASAKVMIRDLPLHAIDNEVLAAVCLLCLVLSPVSYSNVWYNRKMTNIHNGDRFLYVEESDLDKLPESIQIGEYAARVFKPKAKTYCKRYRDTGHHHTDLGCCTHIPLDLQGTVEAFYGGKFPLSNLHKCPHGYVLKEGEPGWEKIFHTSEHRYQFYKLKEHDKVEEAFDLLEENSFKVIQKAKAILLESELNEE